MYRRRVEHRHVTLSMSLERLNDTELLLEHWSRKRIATKTALQSLIGKLVLISKCVPQSRIFIARILALLRTLRFNHHHDNLTAEFQNDIAWWGLFLRSYNGVSMISTEKSGLPLVKFLLPTLACPVAEVFCDDQYFHSIFPSFIMKRNININLFFQELHRLCRDLKHSQRSAYSRETFSNLRTQFKAFFLFCFYFQFIPVPAQLDTMCLYVQFLSRTLTLPSIKKYLTGVELLHLFSGADFSFTKDFILALTLRGIARHVFHTPRGAPRSLPLFCFGFRSFFCAGVIRARRHYILLFSLWPVSTILSHNLLNNLIPVIILPVVMWLVQRTDS